MGDKEGRVERVYEEKGVKTKGEKENKNEERDATRAQSKKKPIAILYVHGGAAPGSRVQSSACVVVRVEFYTFSRVCVGFLWSLWFPPTVQKHAGMWIGFNLICQCLCV